MKEWQERVILEQKELGEKLKSLCEYIECNDYDMLSLFNRGMLAQQEEYMQKYYGVLSARIALF